MSRSKKKPIITDVTKEKKKISHKKFRRKVKQDIQADKLDELPLNEREITNQYDVCDYKYIIDKENKFYNKSKRK